MLPRGGGGALDLTPTHRPSIVLVGVALECDTDANHYLEDHLYDGENVSESAAHRIATPKRLPHAIGRGLHRALADPPSEEQRRLHAAPPAPFRGAGEQPVPTMDHGPGHATDGGAGRLFQEVVGVPNALVLAIANAVMSAGHAAAHGGAVRRIGRHSGIPT